jgi:hypothetical protein
MQTAEALKFRQELDENQKMVRDMVLQSVNDVKAGKGKDYKTFFDELERRYTND